MVATRAVFCGRLRGLGLVLVLAGCGSLGCGEPKYQPPPVGGVVRWQDDTEPRDLEGGSVEFEADGAIAATAPLTADGTFRLEKALPPGSYRVRVTVPSTGKPSVLDPRFESFDTSGLTFNATSEPQQATFRVRKRGR